MNSLPTFKLWFIPMYLWLPLCCHQHPTFSHLPVSSSRVWNSCRRRRPPSTAMDKGHSSATEQAVLHCPLKTSDTLAWTMDSHSFLFCFGLRRNGSETEWQGSHPSLRRRSWCQSPPSCHRAVLQVLGQGPWPLWILLVLFVKWEY
jgi:hypothetical protein